MTSAASVTSALVVVDLPAADGGPAALLAYDGSTLLAAGLERLSRLGVAPVAILARKEWADAVDSAVGGGRGGVPVQGEPDLAALLDAVAAALDDEETLPGALALIPGELVLPDAALAELLDDSRLSTAVAVSAVGAAREGDVRTRARRVLSAGSAVHRVSAPDARSTGAILVGRAERPAAAGALREAARCARASAWQSAQADPLALALVALVRGGLPVGAVDLGEWPWECPADAASAAAASVRLAAVDEQRTRLARSSRANDGFYSTFVVRRASKRLTAPAIRLGISPNTVTVISTGIGLGAAACFARGGRPWRVAGGALMQLSLVVDCVDGEVARYTRRFTKLGAWLDGSSDRVKEYAAYAGLAAGAARRGEDVWLAAAAQLVLQTTRHMADYNFALAQQTREVQPARLPLDRPDDGADAASATGWSSGRAVAWSEQSNRREAVRWAKRVVHMPIAERWLVLSAGAALASPRATFRALSGLGLLALAYTTAGRALRTRSWRRLPPPPGGDRAVRDQLDLGPLARAAGSALDRVRPVRPGGAWLRPPGRMAGIRHAAWALPSLLRLGEYSTVLAATRAVAPAATPRAYALLFVLAYGHYDTLYRVLAGQAPSPRVQGAGLGVDGRLLLLGALAAAGPGRLVPGLAVLAGAGGVLFVGVGGVSSLRALLAADAPGAGSRAADGADG